MLPSASDPVCTKRFSMHPPALPGAPWPAQRLHTDVGVTHALDPTATNVLYVFCWDYAGLLQKQHQYLTSTTC